MAKSSPPSDDGDRDIATVFQAPDQAEMIARLDAVADDDVDSTFFPAVPPAHEDAAARMFDLGLRTLAEAADAPPAGPFVEGAGGSEPVRHVDAGAVASSRGGVDFSDPATRAAFILGGPAALN
jgi:hypothetical protein